MCKWFAIVSACRGTVIVFLPATGMFSILFTWRECGKPQRFPLPQPQPSAPPTTTMHPTRHSPPPQSPRPSTPSATTPCSSCPDPPPRSTICGFDSAPHRGMLRLMGNWGGLGNQDHGSDKKQRCVSAAAHRESVDTAERCVAPPLPAECAAPKSSTQIPPEPCSSHHG